MALTASLMPGATAAGRSWNLLSPDDVAKARLSKTAVKNIGPPIKTVEFRKGGKGNVEVCGFERTGTISASRQSRWDTGDRQGSTTIMQFPAVVDGGGAFSRLKQVYLACTADDFDRPDRVDVRSRLLTKKQQMRLVRILYTSAAKNRVQRAEGLRSRAPVAP